MRWQISVVIQSLFIVWAVAAPPASSQPPAVLEGSVRFLSASTVRRAAELRVEATVRNRAHQSWRAPVVALSTPQLSIDVYDAQGRRVPTIPPPVPRRGDGRTALLHHGEARSFVLSLGVFSPELPPGSYTLVWGARQGIVTPPVSFIVVAD